MKQAAGHRGAAKSPADDDRRHDDAAGRPGQHHRCDHAGRRFRPGPGGALHEQRHIGVDAEKCNSHQRAEQQCRTDGALHHQLRRHDWIFRSPFDADEPRQSPPSANTTQAGVDRRRGDQPIDHRQQGCTGNRQRQRRRANRDRSSAVFHDRDTATPIRQIPRHQTADSRRKSIANPSVSTSSAPIAGPASAASAPNRAEHALNRRPFFQRENIAQNRQHHRHDAAGPEPLEAAKNNQLQQRMGAGRQHRGTAK